MTKPLRVKQVDWIATTARWGVGIILALVFFGLLYQAACGEM